jgi:hypothetical protein
MLMPNTERITDDTTLAFNPYYREAAIVDGNFIQASPTELLEPRVRTVTEPLIKYQLRTTGDKHEMHIDAALVLSGIRKRAERKESKTLAESKKEPQFSRIGKPSSELNIGNYHFYDTGDEHMPYILDDKGGLFSEYRELYLEELNKYPPPRFNSFIPIFCEGKKSESAQVMIAGVKDLYWKAYLRLRFNLGGSRRYTIPPILVTKTDETFNSHALEVPPGWAEIYTSALGMIITKNTLVEQLSGSHLPADLQLKRLQEMVHEIGHGAMMGEVIKTFPNVSREELNSFFYKHLLKNVHIGFLEGVVSAIAEQEQPAQFYKMAEDQGFPPLDTLRLGMSDAEKGPLAVLTPSYLTAPMYARAGAEFLLNILHLAYRDDIEELTDEELIPLFGPQNIKNKLIDPPRVTKRKDVLYKLIDISSGLRALYDIYCDYFVEDFKRFRNNDHSLTFEQYFEDITGVGFDAISNYAHDIFFPKEAAEFRFNPKDLKVKYSLVDYVQRGTKKTM